MKIDKLRCWVLMGLLVLGLAVLPGGATEEKVIGGTVVGAFSWEDAAVSAPVIDFSGRPGWIQPNSVGENINIAKGTLERGGRVTSPNAGSVLRLGSAVLKEKLNGMVDGDPATAFEAKNVTATGILLVFDLGARFGVNQIRFFPRQTFKDDYMKGYVLSINDGEFGADIIAASGQQLPDKTLVTVIAQKNDNTRDTIDVRIPLQYVRYLRLESTQRFSWEIDELQIFGRGYVPEADYLSQVFDMNQAALWGNLKWFTEQTGLPEKSRVILRTRSGSSPSPEDQPDDWSAWSTPYKASGDPILSPAPRRFLQFSMSFESDGLEDATLVDSLAFEFFSPALALTILGEISPQEVPVGHDTTFTYAVKVGNAQGFDKLEIDTPAPVTAIRQVSVDGVEIATTAQDMHENGLSVSFARQTGNRNLRVVFDSAVLRYETVFVGRIYDTTRAGSLPQAVESGDADEAIEGDDLSVRVPLKGQPLVHQLSISPRSFSPNGDGFNDRVTISYDLLYLTNSVPVAVKIYNLAGDVVAELPLVDNPSGRHLRQWDGRDLRGELLNPGLYILQVEVDADSGTESRSSIVAIAY